MASSEVWRSWSGLTTCSPTQVVAPATPSEVVDAVIAARANGLRVKMVGSGHSFTDVAMTDGLLLRPDRLVGIRSVDRDAMTVSVLAGTPLHVLNDRLHRLGLALHNMGDVDRQTVAGAISTGTHGTGGRRASLSAQVVGLELVTGDGTVRQARPDGTPEEAALLEAARVGLGALGILTTVTFEVEPAFTLSAVEEPMTWGEVVDGFDDLAEGNEHFEAYWFPHTDRMLTKRNNRTREARPTAALARVPRRRGALEHGVRAGQPGGQRRAPAGARAEPGGVGALSARAFSDSSHRVFTSPRRVVFREMEYAVPREAGMQALTEARALIEKNGWRISFPVEIRHAPRDDIWLSTAYDRATVYLAFHVNAQTDHTTYFSGVEQVLKAYDGRPHWGKLHTRTADDLAPTYPRHGDFVALRDRLDPDRLFTNAYLDRVLGGHGDP